MRTANAVAICIALFVAATTANGCFRKLNQMGNAFGYPPPNPGDALESDLDIEMISASCPNCNIMLVEASSQAIFDLAAAVDTAVGKGANIVSNSYQVSSASGDAYASHYEHRGVLVVAAAGDAGYETQGGFPSDLPTVVSVGGATLTRGGTGRGWSESVWGLDHVGLGSGSGCTTTRTPKPPWQLDRGPNTCLYRTMNDVAALGDPQPGVLEYDSYGRYGPWLVSGGTSVGTPLIAGIYGLAENAATQAGARSLYARPAGFPNPNVYDITTGFNGTCWPAYLCNAEPGYDGPSGNGTPHGIGAF